MNQCAWLLAALALGGCEDSSNETNGAPLVSRPVATVYQIDADEDNERVGCYSEPTVTSKRLAWVYQDQFVDLVSPNNPRTLRRNNEFWVHVYPRLAVRAACYINTRYLIPYS